MTHEPQHAADPARSPDEAGTPTPFADLNALLQTLVEGARERLGPNLVGVYLQGSHALGDFDEHSDADVVIVVDQDIGEDELPALQALHDALHALSNPWARRLECGYFPAAILRRWSLSPRDPPGLPPRPTDWADPGAGGRPPRGYPLLFKGNGERELVRSEHDNTQVVRWVLREKGIALAGPAARDLVDPVDAAALRAEAAPLLTEIAGWRDPARMQHRGIQAFFVLLTCRLLYTLRTGEIASKATAANWACRTLDPQWARLIGAAQAARREPAQTSEAPADPAEVERTLAFLAYGAAAAGGGQSEAERAREVIARALALKKHGGQPHGGPRSDRRGASGPKRGGFTPPPIRPGGRGRRG